MIDQLIALKDYILDKYAQYNTGFANVQKPDGTDVVLDVEGQQYAGIADNKGNYFYIRSLKDSRYTVMGRSCRPLYYQRVTTCRIVSLMKGVNDESHLQAVVNAVSMKGHDVTRSVTERTQVFFEETGTRNITDGLKTVSLLYVDFEITDVVSAKNCSLEICEC